MIQKIFHLYTNSSRIIVTNFYHTRSHRDHSKDHPASNGVILSISPEARQLQDKFETGKDKSIKDDDPQNRSQLVEHATSKPKGITDPTSEISPEEERLIQRLKQNDAKVRTHERQHVAAAAGYLKSGPVYEYITGPDGKRYAVAGHVSLDMSPIPNNPEATIRKARIIKKAALAPDDPSPADRAVAASANTMELKARKELQEKQKTETKDTGGKEPNPRVKAYARSHYQPGLAVNLLF
jgi:hypothetical protein